MHPVLDIIVAVLISLYYIVEALVLAFIPLEWRKPKDVSKDIALITGGGSGIGRLLALRLAEKGATIVLWDVSHKGNEETKKMIKEIGGEAYSYEVDISQRNQVHEAALRVRDDVGNVTILFNNAGIVSGSDLLDTSDTKITKTFDVNVVSHFWTLKEFLPGMIRTKRGHVVSTASLAGLVATQKLADYCASKFACVGLHEAVAQEMEDHGIDFTLVCPFYISTGMFKGVTSPFLPILEPGYVADEIINALLYRKDMVVLPKIATSLVTLKTILPRKAIVRLASALHLDKTMAGFVGRK